MSETEGNEIRLQLLALLGRLSAKYPALRICQLIGNAVPWGNQAGDHYYVEDSQLITWLHEFETKADDGIRQAKKLLGSEEE